MKTRIMPEMSVYKGVTVTLEQVPRRSFLDCESRTTTPRKTYTPELNRDIREYNKSNKDPKMARLTFGKYKGYFVKDIPEDYLQWAVLNLTDQAMAQFLADELIRRRPDLAK